MYLCSRNEAILIFIENLESFLELLFGIGILRNKKSTLKIYSLYPELERMDKCKR